MLLLGLTAFYLWILFEYKIMKLCMINWPPARETLTGFFSQWLSKIQFNFLHQLYLYSHESKIIISWICNQSGCFSTFATTLNKASYLRTFHVRVENGITRKCFRSATNWIVHRILYFHNNGPANRTNCTIRWQILSSWFPLGNRLLASRLGLGCVVCRWSWIQCGMIEIVI